MAQPTLSQIAPIPQNLPFKLVSGTIGTGAYAFIRKAVPLGKSSPIIAVKFINKEHAYSVGRLKPKQLMNEITLHKHLTQNKEHKNIISFHAAGEDSNYTWIAMELAEGGDLFDKIESDVGVGTDIAHVYFTQLINAISFMHGMGVAHRDIKPENVLLSSNGNLKLADFGLASLYKYQGKTKKATSVVGSPPYMAPELVTAAREGYEPDIADIWSCGIVLFVLLVGNTPWDEPTKGSYEFLQYLNAGGKSDPNDDLWGKLPSETLSLLHAMLKLDPHARFRLNEVRTHPWFTRHNDHLSSSGSVIDPVKLATQMMQKLRVDFDAPPSQSIPQSQLDDSMDLDTQFNAAPTRTPHHTHSILTGIDIAATQPEAPMADYPANFERPVFANSQPTLNYADDGDAFYNRSTQLASERRTLLETDVSMSQFSRHPQLPLSLTQMARNFNDIAPSWSVNHFLSDYPADLLVEKVTEALLALSAQTKVQWGNGSVASIQVVATSRRKQGMKGSVVFEKYGREHFDVRFVKAKGDPIEWRRMFKDVAILCKDMIVGRDGYM